MTKTRMLLPALLLTACATTSILDESRNYAKVGDPFRAFELLDEEREARLRSAAPIDDEFEAAWREARLAFLLARGRRSIFLEREEEALVDLAKVLAIDPDHVEAPILRQRAFDKLAARATERGDEALAKTDLEKALACYIEAEHHVPGFKGAVEGAEKVRTAVARLTARAQEQFLEAVRKMPEFRYVEVRWHSANALNNDPTREDAEALRARAQHEIALRTMERGQECQQRDQFGAALVEYRSAKKLEENLPGIVEAIAQMEREVQAAWLADAAQMDVRMGRFDKARANLEKAFELSTLARGGISELMIEARKLEGERDYKIGRDFEIQGKKREALAAYEALSKNWPDGLQDEKARIEGLRLDIDSAEKEWVAAEAAEAAGDLPKALEHYLAAEQFYGGYKNVKQRIASVRERLQPAAKGTTSGG